MEEALRQISFTSSSGMDAKYSVGLGSSMNKSRDHHGGGYVKMKKKDKVGIKKKLKLLKGLSRNLSTFSDMGFTVDHDQNLLGQVRGKMITEAAELLMKQLEQMKVEEKQLKMKRKQEKAKLKGRQCSAACESDSSDSSDSECECEEETIKVKSSLLISDPPPPVLKSEQSLPNAVTSDGMTKKIEVCMGNKCRKLGGGDALLQEFQRSVGAECYVVGCKCMGKCRDGPNVRLFNSQAGSMTPPNPLCIGVGLEDVGAIITNFVAQDNQALELGFNPAS